MSKRKAARGRAAIPDAAGTDPLIVDEDGKASVRMLVTIAALGAAVRTVYRCEPGLARQLIAAGLAHQLR